MEAHWGTQIKCANKNTRIYAKNSNRKKNYRAARKFTIFEKYYKKKRENVTAALYLRLAD